MADIIYTDSGKILKILKKFWKNFGKILEKFWKILEKFWKVRWLILSILILPIPIPILIPVPIPIPIPILLLPIRPLLLTSCSVHTFIHPYFIEPVGRQGSRVGSIDVGWDE